MYYNVTFTQRCKNVFLMFFITVLKTCIFMFFGSFDVFMHVFKNVFYKAEKTCFLCFLFAN